MKRINKGLLIKLLMLFLITFYNCGKDAGVKQNVIRPLVKLATEDIPPLENAIQGKYSKPSWIVHEFNDNYVVRYTFCWEKKDYIYIDEYIAENKKAAHEYLQEMHKNYTHPYLEEMKDQPAMVGDLSYFQGREFIRDNIIVTIHASGEFESRISHIAQCVDDKILKSHVFSSIDQVKPVIKRFEVIQKPVKKNSKIKLIVDVEDPNNKNIYLYWRLGLDSIYRELQKDDSGNYYFISGITNPDVAGMELTLIAINEFCFCSDASIKILIECK